MKKSMLCILLVCVLLLGGCTLISPPAETKGMASCTQLMLELHSMIKPTEQFLLEVFNATPETDPSRIQQSKNDLDYTMSRLKNTVVPSCQPYLADMMSKEEEVSSLLDDYAEVHRLTYEAFEHRIQKDEKNFLALWQKAVDKSKVTSYNIRTLIVSWQDTNLQVISSVGNTRFQSGRAEKISNCQQVTEMLLLLKESEIFLDYGRSQAMVYFMNGESSDREYVEICLETHQRYQSAFQLMYDSASRKVKKLAAPLKKELFLPMDSIAQQLQTAIEAMKTQNDPGAAEIIQYRQDSTEAYAFLRLSFIQYEGQCIRDFKKALD